MTLRGSVETIGLVDLLQLIQGNGHSGTLKVVAGDASSKLYFYKGQLYLPTGGAGGALKIGALLVRARKITGRDLLKALQLQAAAGGDKLGEVLVREGLVEKDDLDLVVRRLYEEEIYDLLFREGAYFEWRRDTLPAGFADARGNIRAMNFDTRSILLEASRRQDEWRLIRKRIPSTKAVYRLSQPDEPAFEESEGVIEHLEPGLEGLPPDEVMAARALAELKKSGAVIEQSPFDGNRSLEDVIALTNLTPFEALQAIARLREEGIVRPIAAPEIEPRAVRAIEEGRRPDAYTLFSWANEADRLRKIASSLDKELLHPKNLQKAGRPAFAGRTGGSRALTILSRLLRRGAPFHLHAREEESAIDVFVTSRVLRLHLMGPRRTHSALRYLKARGALSDEDLKNARDTQKKTGRDIDRILVEDKIVSREAWLLAVKDKVVSALFSMFEWSDPFIEVTGDSQIPPAGDEIRGLVVEIPLDEQLREDLRKDLLRWKSILEAVPSPDVVFTCVRPTPRGEPKRTHDLLDGRRAVADLLALAKIAPLELVRFLLEALLDRRIRRLTDREHQERLEAAVAGGRLDDAIVYAKSAVAFGFSPDLYRRKLVELREHRKGMPSAEGRPTVQGELGQVSLAEVLQLLHQGKRTGTLRITGAAGAGATSAGEKTLYFDGGEIFILNIDGPGPDAELQALLGESATDRLGMSSFVAMHGRLKEEDVAKAEMQRIKADLFEAFLWEGARFEFLQNFLPPELRAEGPNTTKLALKTDLLLFEAMQRLAEWDEMRKVLKSAHAVFRFDSADAKSEAIAGKDGALAYLFDGDLSLAEVVRRSGEDRYRVYRFASELVGKKALVFSHQKNVAPVGDTPTRRILATSGRVQRVAPSPEPSIHKEKMKTPARGFPGLSAVADDTGKQMDDSINELDRVQAPTASPSASDARRWGDRPRSGVGSLNQGSGIGSPPSGDIVELDSPEVEPEPEPKEAEPKKTKKPSGTHKSPDAKKKKSARQAKSAKPASSDKPASSEADELPKKPPANPTRRWGAPPGKT
jgi:hypothetical protein